MRRLLPRTLVTNNDEWFAPHFDLMPTVAWDEHTQATQSATNVRHLQPVIVIAENRDGGAAPAKPTQDRHDPAYVPAAVGDVASNGDEVRLPISTSIHDEAEIIAVRCAAEV